MQIRSLEIQDIFLRANADGSRRNLQKAFWRPRKSLPFQDRAQNAGIIGALFIGKKLRYLSTFKKTKHFEQKATFLSLSHFIQNVRN